jgi:hypothetical protein
MLVISSLVIVRFSLTMKCRTVLNDFSSHSCMTDGNIRPTKDLIEFPPREVYLIQFVVRTRNTHAMLFWLLMKCKSNPFFTSECSQSHKPIPVRLKVSHFIQPMKWINRQQSQNKEIQKTV